MSGNLGGTPETTNRILELKISNFNIVAAVLGGFLTLFGLVSYLLKEKFYLGEALISTIFGLIFSENAAGLIRPLEYAQNDEESLESITLYFTRLVLGVQLVIAGIQLPAKYLKKEWRSLGILLGPGMCFMWITTALIVWALVPNIPFVYALAVGSCVTPTDPVLSNSIVKGKFADKNIPRKLQNLIVAESGSNDGLGYPFLFIALYLIQFTHDSGNGSPGGASTAMGYWFGITWGYEIVMSLLYGALVGYIFRLALKYAEEKKWVDRESFIVFSITIALFIVGTLGMLGSDDVLACFIAGNVFSWDDWFRMETEDDSFQATIDMLLNVAIFAWYGAVCPWYQFAHNSVIPIYRLIFIGVLVLLFRRLPMVLAFYKWPGLHQLEDLKQAGFVGFFGPMGVSAIFYLYTSREFLRTLVVYRGREREDAEELAEVFLVVVWFVVICSIIVHGISIPLGKLGIYLPRTLSRASSSGPTTGWAASAASKNETSPDSGNTDPDEPAPLGIAAGLRSEERALEEGAGRIRRAATDAEKEAERERRTPLPKKVRRIGGTIMKDLERDRGEMSEVTKKREERKDAEGQDEEKAAAQDEERAAAPQAQTGLTVPTAQDDAADGRSPARSIRFPDEQHRAGDGTGTAHGRTTW